MQTFKVSLVLLTDKAKGTTEAEKLKSKLPIYFRIYIEGRRTLKSTGYSVERKHWDADNELVKSTYRNSGHINADLERKRSDLMKTLIEDQIAGKQISVATVRKTIDGAEHTNIFDFVDSFKTEVNSKRAEGTMENYVKHLKKLELYHGSKNLRFDDITADYLIRYENHLRETVGNNYTHGLLKTLRTFFNAAIKKKLITNYPFKEIEFPKYKSPIKDYLTIDELKKWENHLPTIKSKSIYETGVYFLFACYCGLRIGDWYKFTSMNIDGDMIRVRTGKTGSNVTMPISIPLKRILKLIWTTPLKIEEATVNEKLKLIAKDLEIKKHITAHTARHTFAVTICLSNKISSETAAELMGITLQTFVENYSQVTDEKIQRETRLAWGNLN